MPALTRLRSAVAVGATVAATLAPSGALAAGPQVHCIQVYASVVPSQKCDPSSFRHQPPVPADVVTPITDVHGLGLAYLGTVVVEGNATPGAQVTVVLHDGFLSLSRVATAAATADEGAGIRAGDFEVVFDPASDLSVSLASVQELGSHSAKEGAVPSSTDPEDLGETVLTATAIAFQGGSASPSLSRPIRKRPATPFDTTGPDLRNLRFPPAHWCHQSGEGAQIAGQDLGGSTDGRCGKLAVDGVGALPDATWTTCTPATATAPEPVPADTWRELRDQRCRTSPGLSHPRATAPLSGKAADLTEASNGAASEIRDVTITIRRGEETLREISGAFARITSTQASWGFELRIEDFAPNWPSGEPYTFTIRAEDAWGNATTVTSHDVWVYPW